MTSLGVPEPTVPADAAAHLDDDAECLEDPVHCGDARHQHEAHRRGTPTASTPTAGTATAGTDAAAPGEPPG